MKLATSLISAAALCGALAAVPAFAADTWGGVYDGTIVATYASGGVVKVYVNADHSYSITTPDGKTLKGVWADSADGSCFTLTDPPEAPGAKPVCLPLKDYKIGDSFAGEDASGKFNAVIVAGR